MADEAERKAAAASARHTTVLEGPDCLGSTYCDGGGGISTPSLSRLTALRYEDIEGRRLILHADLCGRAKGDASSSTAGGGGDGQELFSEAVQVVVEQVREILSANPAVVAIVSELAPLVTTAVTATVTATPDEGPPLSPLGLLVPEVGPSPPSHTGTEVAASSLRATAATVSSLLGMEVDFYDSVPELAVALEQCGGGDGGGGGGSWAASFGAKVMMVERLGAPGVVPAPPAEEPVLSDDEEERLPDFGWGGEGMITYDIG